MTQKSCPKATPALSRCSPTSLLGRRGVSWPLFDRVGGERQKVQIFKAQGRRASHNQFCFTECHKMEKHRPTQYHYETIPLTATLLKIPRRDLTSQKSSYHYSISKITTIGFSSSN